MADLSVGQIVPLENGKSAKIVQELGRGGQGIVYLVDVDGAKYALKWYLTPQTDWFYNNIKNNSSRLAPSPNFLWAVTITKKIDGVFGYIMPLRKDGYKELGDYFCADRKTGKMRATFKSFTAMLNAAINICNAFGRLHIEGFSFQDINEGGFFINPETGDVLICDTDNIVANNSGAGFDGGKPRYMAAEVVDGGHPNTNSDLFSLAIILYRIFILDHPLEGKLTASYPCLDDQTERFLYGKGAVFTFDSNDDRNRPSHIHRNANLRWSMCPPSLQKMFQSALGHEAIIDPNKRVRDNEWKRLFVKLRRELIVCHNKKHSSDLDFMYELASNASPICPFCKQETPVTCKMVFDGTNEEYVLTRHKKLYLGDSTIPVGYCRIRTVDGRTDLGIQNLSGDTWRIQTATGKINTLPPNELMPLRNGMYIRFNQQSSVKVIVK